MEKKQNKKSKACGKKDIHSAKNKNELNLNYGLEIERVDAKNLKDKGYDFIPRLGNLTSSQEQKLKTKEIEEKTK